MKAVYISVIVILLAFVAVVFIWIEPIGTFLYPNNLDRNAEVVKLMLSIIGGIAVLLGLYIAHKRAVATEISVENQSKQLEHSQKSQIDERFKNAVEHLGNDKEAVILGGVVELHQIAQANKQTYAEVVFNILTSYVRSQTNNLEVDPMNIKTTVIQTICDYLFKNKDNSDFPYLSCVANLEHTNLRSVNLDNADLSKINFQDSFLPSGKNVNYQNANLTACHFFDGTIEDCIFFNANLFQTKFLFLTVLNSHFGGNNNYGASFYFSRIKGLNIQNNCKGYHFFYSIIKDFNLSPYEFSFNKFLFCNLLNIDFSKAKIVEFSDFSNSGFLNCRMPKNIYKTIFSSCFDLKDSTYSLFSFDEIRLVDMTSFVAAKTNKTDLSGIIFAEKTVKTECKEDDLTEDFIEKQLTVIIKSVKIPNHKKYANSINEIITIKLKRYISLSEDRNQ